MKIMDSDGEMNGSIRLNDILDQDSEMPQDTNEQCSCDFCCIKECPIVAVDGLLFRCCVNGESYIPTEVVEFNELIRSLQKRLAAIETRRRSFSVQLTPPKREKFSNNERNNNMMSLFTFRSRCSAETSPPLMSGQWAEKPRTKPAINRVQSSPSLKTAPNSILLKYSSKQLAPSCGKSDLPDSSNEDIEMKLRTKYAEQLAWFRDNGRDFVALETMKTLTEASALLSVLVENKSPTLVQLKVTCSQTITVSYQFLDKFKQEFMMLKVSDSYCMFMAPF